MFGHFFWLARFNTAAFMIKGKSSLQWITMSKFIACTKCYFAYTYTENILASRTYMLPINSKAPVLPFPFWIHRSLFSLFGTSYNSSIVFCSAVTLQSAAFMIQFLTRYCAVARQTVANKITNLHICFQMEDWKEQGESKRALLSHYLLLAMALSMRTHIWKEILLPRWLPWEMKFCKFFVYIIFLQVYDSFDLFFMFRDPLILWLL